MDPNSLSSLDPKLRETYERVMGTPTPASPPDSSTPASPRGEPEAAPKDTSAQIPSPSAVNPPTPPVNTPQTTPLTQTTVGQEQAPVPVTISQPIPAPAPMTPLSTPHKHSGLIKVFYILGAMVFFTIYVYFWARIFNVKLPF